MESAHLLESSLFCCHRCKGLFNSLEERMKHQVSCIGNPSESTCVFFACERKIFLQLFQPDDFLLDGCDLPFSFSKDDSFINHFVKVRMPDIFDPSIFLKNTPQPNTVETDDSNDSNFLLESNINTLEQPDEGTNSSAFLESDKPVNQAEQDKIQSIINKNIEYLKGNDLPSLNEGQSKVGSFPTQTLPRLFSPIDKHLHFFGDGTKSRVHSPFERSSGFLQDSQIYGSGSFMYSSNPSIPLACGLSTDLFSSISFQPDENQQPFPSCIEECPNLRYLDLAKKDPFFGQNTGLSQINTKDPFLINASAKSTERLFQTGLQKSHLTRSCEELASPTLHVQENNTCSFSFPSTLDEPTQLDYLDLATLDFLTNPNLISYGQWFNKERSYERDDDMYSEDNIICQNQSNLRAETATRLGNVASFGSGSSSAFSKIKNKKILFKKSKSDLQRREDFTGKPRENFEGLAEFQESLGRLDNKEIKDILKSNDEIKSTPEPETEKEFRLHVFRKRKLDTPKSSPAVHVKVARPTKRSYERKRRSSESAKSTRPVKIFNVREKLTQFTEEEKDNMKAVLGQSGCIFVKKKRSLSCDEPVVFVNDSQAFGPIGKLFVNKFMDQKTSESFTKARRDKFSSNSKALEFLDQARAKKFTSVLLLKCQECNFKCRSVVELKNHKVLHSRITIPQVVVPEVESPSAKANDDMLVQLHDLEHVSNNQSENNVSVLTSNADSFVDSTILRGENHTSVPGQWDGTEGNTLGRVTENKNFISQNVDNNAVSYSMFNEVDLQVTFVTSTPTSSTITGDINIPNRRFTSLQDETLLAVETITDNGKEFKTDEQSIDMEATQTQDTKITNEEFNVSKEINDTITGTALVETDSEDMNLFPELSQTLTNQYEPELPIIREELFCVENVIPTTKSSGHDLKSNSEFESGKISEDMEFSVQVDDQCMPYQDEVSKNQVVPQSQNILYPQSNLTRSLSLQLDLSESPDDMTRIKNELGLRKSVFGTQKQDFWLNPFSQNVTKKASSEPYLDSLDAVIKPLFQDMVVDNVNSLSPKFVTTRLIDIDTGRSKLESNMNQDYEQVQMEECGKNFDSRACQLIDLHEETSHKKHGEEGIFENGDTTSGTNEDKTNHNKELIFRPEPDSKNVLIILTDNERNVKRGMKSPTSGILEEPEEGSKMQMHEISLSEVVVNEENSLNGIESKERCFSNKTQELINDQRGTFSICGELEHCQQITNEAEFNKEMCDYQVSSELEDMLTKVEQMQCDAGNTMYQPNRSLRPDIDLKTVEDDIDSDKYKNKNISLSHAVVIPTCIAGNGTLQPDVTQCSALGDRLLDNTNIDTRSEFTVIKMKALDTDNNQFPMVPLSDNKPAVLTTRASSSSSLLPQAKSPQKNDSSVEETFDLNRNKTCQLSAFKSDGQQTQKKRQTQIADNGVQMSVLSVKQKEPPPTVVAAIDDGKAGISKSEPSTSHSPGSSGISRKDGEIYHCEMEGCMFSTVYQRNLTAHYQAIHLHLARYLCDQCSFVTPRSSTLKLHIAQKHSQDNFKRFQCPECDFQSFKRSDVVKHVKNVHLKQKQYMCNQCTYKTGHTQSLKLHLMQHGGICPYKCSACSYQVNTSSKVWRHIKSKHKDEEGVTCEKSDITFKVDAKQFQCGTEENDEDIHVIELGKDPEKVELINVECHDQPGNSLVVLDRQKIDYSQFAIAYDVKKIANVHNNGLNKNKQSEQKSVVSKSHIIEQEESNITKPAVKYVSILDMSRLKNS